MYFSFDLISDLHLESRNDFDWTGQPTSQCCIIAGDLSSSISDVVSSLTHLSQCYKKILYIDGNTEHRWNYSDIGTSYQILTEEIQKIPNVIFLQDNMIIVDGVAIVGTNGWWTYDFDPTIDFDKSVEYTTNRYNITKTDAIVLRTIAINDANYLANTIRKCQTIPDIKKIVVVTHTVPHEVIAKHDRDLIDNYQYNLLGNSYIKQILEQDTERKVDTWCFGHYHQDVQLCINNINYVNNCMGKKGSKWSKPVYYPKRIEIVV